ncbi:MAG: hypothetical protein KQJ78_02860 [Deltaproteobacteria bacterium]|nr:hypothetical protein [Deltaproteobacteria bacterium]
MRRLLFAKALVVLVVLWAVPALAGWDKLPGQGRDVGCGGGQVWVVGSNSGSGGSAVWQWTGGNWRDVGGGAVRLDVDRHGNPWVVNREGDIYRLENGQWKKLPGQARDIGCGADGSVWVIGADSAGGGYGVWQWNHGSWTRTNGSGVRIDVDNRGRPWVVANNGAIWVMEGGGNWRQMPGKARDVGCGADGSVWVVGDDSASGGGSVWKLTGSNWTKYDAGAAQISVDQGGRPWVVNSRGDLYVLR